MVDTDDTRHTTDNATWYGISFPKGELKNSKEIHLSVKIILIKIKRKILGSPCKFLHCLVI